MNKRPHTERQSVRLLLFVFLQFALQSMIQAQTIIEGTVLDTSGKVTDAFVTAAAKGSATMIAFSDVDSEGHYKMVINSKADSLTLTVSGLNIATQKKNIPNRSARFNFRVEEEGMQLKEVSIRAKKIRQNGDTLNYYVSSYQQQSDRTIGDVLKRMPGIEVADDGGIKFNGKEIKKFYVEDMDLLQGRYGLATNNINAQDVATVQVLRQFGISQCFKTVQVALIPPHALATH